MCGSALGERVRRLAVARRFIVGDPSAVVTSDGTDLFVRGGDDQVYANHVAPSGAVTGYSVVPGLTVTGEIESIVPADGPAGSVRIFARGPEGAVWTNVRRNGAWTGWSSLGGFITSNIAIRDSDPINALAIFARGEDNRVYTRDLFTIGARWKPLDGVTATSDITVTSRALYVRGADNAVYVNPQNSGTGAYLGFQRVDGAVTGNPAAFTLQPNGGPLTQYLLARQPNGTLAFTTGGPPFAAYTPISGPTIN